MSDLDLAAERLRKLYAGQSYYETYGCEQSLGGHQHRDERKILDAWFAEHDPTLISEEWLRSVGFKWKDGQTQAWWLMHHRLIIGLRLSGQWWLEFDATYSGRVGTYNKLKTRGDVRRLAACLGIELKGESNGKSG